MNRTMLSLSSIGAGAALMYWLDPLHGRRRRADMRNRAVRLATEGTKALDVGIRDLENRAQGFKAEARSFFTSEQPSDEVVVQRARSRLGRVCSRPSLVETSCYDGNLVLKGQVLERERRPLLSAMARVRGVRSVESHLEPFDTSAPGFQPRRRVGQGQFRSVRGWTPAGRLIATGCGLGMCLYGFQRGGFFGTALATSGGFLAMRGITNFTLRQMVGFGETRKPIRLAKTIDVDAPVDEVFQWLSKPEHFPKFMSHIQEVRPKGNGQYHWKVAGPAGIQFEWDADLTHIQQNKELAWRTEPGSIVEHAGVVHCEPNRHGTRVTVRMSYHPPAGALGHSFAKLFGADPKSQLDSDLIRFKSLIEQGKATARGRTVHREDIEEVTTQLH